MTVGKICNRSVVIAPRETSIGEAARLMREYHVGDVLVFEEREGQRIPVGILTDRDIVIEVLAGRLDPEAVTAGDVMSFELATAREDESIADAIKRMRSKGVRRLPVVDAEGVLVGILTVDDLLELLAGELADLAALVAREQTREQEQRP